MYFPNPVNPKTFRIPFLTGAALCFAALSLTGCLYTTHHFNSGRLLKPGQTAVTLGYGKAHYLDENCPSGYYLDWDEKGNTHQCRYYGGNVIETSSSIPPAVDTLVPSTYEQINTPKFSLGYRLGVRGKWGPLTGIELGWTMEAPTNPATVEFDLKAGLPLPKAWKASHSLSGGWGIGMWADNTWFLEYAASKQAGNHTLYGNYRWSRLASQPQDLDSSFANWKFVPHRRIINQVTAGYMYRMPDWALLPDFLGPQATFTFPMLAGFGDISPVSKQAFDLNYNLAFGWDF